jgi:riboflavin synthase alpha subunit
VRNCASLGNWRTFHQAAEVTTLGELRQGGEVNLEIDVVARYLQRMASLRG